MRRFDSRESFLQYAYRLLSYRGRSEKELREKLKKKGACDDTVNTIISRLRSNGFIDDISLAGSLKRYAEEQKHLSISGTRRFLADRGISKDIIENEVKDMDEAESAKKLVEKKLRRMDNYSPDVIIRKLYGILSRKGYPYETIRKTLRKFNFKEDPG